VFIGYYAKLSVANVVGIQISASHNACQDNGLKITGWDGGMMDPALEPLLERFCNM
jgi:phosphomannomutase